MELEKTMKEIQKILHDFTGKILVIHHWDTDGICSARLLLQYLKNKNVVTKTPVLGNYFLVDHELEHYSTQYDLIVIADMGLPEHNIQKLSTNAHVIILDHHLQNIIQEKNVVHMNPIALGCAADEYPSASWIVTKTLDLPITLYGLLGIVGDHEQKITNNPVFHQLITTYCTEHNLQFQNLLQMVYLLDSSYKLGDKQAVEHAPHQLLNHEDPSYILAQSTWKKNLQTLDAEIKKYLTPSGEELQGIFLKKMNTPYNIISTVTRQLAWKTGRTWIVVNTGFFSDMDQLYVRSSKNVEPLIQKGKQLGFKAGGKKEVLGVVLPKDKTDDFVKEIISFLST